MTDLEIAKSKVPLVDIIPGEKTQKGKYIFVNPCPVCGHKDHFCITGTHYHSFGGCINRGTIIDWIMYKENIPFNEAKDKILQMAGITEYKPSKRELKIKLKQKIEQELIEEKFNKIYDSLVFYYKTLKSKESKLNDFGLSVLNFVDIMSEKFIKTDNTDNKAEMIKIFFKELLLLQLYYSKKTQR